MVGLVDSTAGLTINAGVAYSITSSGSALVQRDSNGNAFANNFTSAVSVVTSAGITIPLTAATPRYINLTGTQNEGFSLPNATTLSLGARFEFNNNSTGVLTVTDASSGALGTVASGGYGIFICVANGTSAGTWDTHFLAPSDTIWGTTGLTLGGPDAASPTAQTLNMQNVLTGTSNTAGVNLTIQGSKGTGTGAGGKIILQTAVAQTTGSTQGTLTTALTLSAPANGQVPSTVVGSGGALATNATDGFLYIPGGAGAPTGTPMAFTGSFPLYWDSTDKKLYLFSGGSWLGGTAPGVWS